MTSKERIALALQHKEADRIAIHDSPWGTTIGVAGGVLRL